MRFLKRAHNRCELCGVPGAEKHLQVDHIVPRSRGGVDELSNFQALCYTCNANKGNRDDADFREWDEIYSQRDEKCVFCSYESLNVVAENSLAIAFRDAYPVTSLHTLVVLRRHIADYFGLYQPEINAIHQLIEELRSAITEEDPSVVGFNIGTNSGAAAGQTVFHCHVHVIPRRQGDMEDPRGGVWCDTCEAEVLICLVDLGAADE